MEKIHLYILMSLHFFINGKNEVIIYLNVEVDHFIIEYINDVITSTLIIWSWWFNWINRWDYVKFHRIRTTKKRNSKIHSRKTLPFFTRITSNLHLIHILDCTNIYIYIYMFFCEYFVFLWNTSRSSRRYEILSKLKKWYSCQIWKIWFYVSLFLWSAQEILSSVFKLFFWETRKSKFFYLIISNTFWTIVLKNENNNYFHDSLIFFDRLIDFETWWKKSL